MTVDNREFIEQAIKEWTEGKYSPEEFLELMSERAFHEWMIGTFPEENE